jgi:hypothetical protein
MLIFSYIAIYLDIILKAKGESDAFAKKKCHRSLSEDEGLG